MAGLEGMRFGDYVIIQRIGSGSMGEVYLAEQERLRRQVAIKTLRELGLHGISAEAREQAIQRFLQEARTVARLEHPHIVRLYDFGQTNDMMYLVMAYIPDGSLADLLRPDAARGQSAAFTLPFSSTLVAQIVEQAAEALQYAHDQGVIHGDVKLQNLLARRLLPEQQAAPDGVENPALANIATGPSLYVLLADFGLTRFLEEISGAISASDAARYMAPEQAQGHPAPASDQYALACVAFELLTGQPVFRGSVAERYQQHLAAAPIPPTQVNPILPRGVDGPLLRALAQDPTQRFPRVADFAQALAQELGVSMPPAASPYFQGRPLPVPSIPWQTPAPASAPLAAPPATPTGAASPTFPGAAFAASNPGAPANPNTTPTPPFGTYSPVSGAYGSYGPAGRVVAPPFQPAPPYVPAPSAAWPVSAPVSASGGERAPDGVPTLLAPGVVAPSRPLLAPQTPQGPTQMPQAPHQPRKMSRRNLLLATGGGVAVLACAGLATASGAYALQHLGPQAKTPPKATTKPIDYTVHVRWKYAIGHSMYSSPLVANGVVYFGADTTFFYALDAATGKARWRSASKGAIYAAPVLVGNTLYIASTDGTVYARAATNGAHVWFTNVRNPIGVTPATDGTTLYCCTYNGNVVALDMASGKTVWTRNVGFGKLAAPAVANGILIVAGEAGLAALSTTDGKSLWSFTPNHTAQQFSRPLINNDVVYAGCFNGAVYALGLKDGSYKWSYLTSGPILDAPAIPTSAAPSNRTLLYVGSQDHNVYALDAVTGKRQWIGATQGVVARTPTVANGTVYVGSHDTILYGLDAQSGRTLWAYHLGGQIDTSPAVTSGVVYSGCDNGLFYAINVTGS